MDISTTRCGASKSPCPAQQFPIYLGDLFSELLTVLMFEKLQEY